MILKLDNSREKLIASNKKQKCQDFNPHLEEKNVYVSKINI